MIIGSAMIAFLALGVLAVAGHRLSIIQTLVYGGCLAAAAVLTGDGCFDSDYMEGPRP